MQCIVSIWLISADTIPSLSINAKFLSSAIDALLLILKVIWVEYENGSTKRLLRVIDDDIRIPNFADWHHQFFYTTIFAGIPGEESIFPGLNEKSLKKFPIKGTHRKDQTKWLCHNYNFLSNIKIKFSLSSLYSDLLTNISS